MVGKMKLTIGSSGAHAAIIGISLMALLMSCANMLTGNDLKTKIGADVAAANAAELTVTVQADPNNVGGQTTPAGNAVSVKVGIPFPISSTVLSAYAFKNWTVASGDGTLTFADSASSDTTATITKAPTSAAFVIQANYYTRATVTVSPDYGATNKNINTPIKLSFSQAMNPLTLSLDNVRVFERDQAVTTWTDVTTTYFSAITASTGNSDFNLTYNTGKLLQQNYNYRIVLSRLIADSNNITMEKGYTATFSTGTGQDVTPPAINYAYVYATSGGTGTGTNIATKLGTVYLNVKATDDSGSVNTIVITETKGLQTIINDPITYQSGNFAYSLHTSWGDGTWTIKIQAVDPTGNTTLLASAGVVTVVYDTIWPTIASVVIKDTSSNNTGFTNGDLTITLGATTDAGTSVASTEYKVDAGGTWTAFTSPSAVTISGIDGATKTIYVRATDAVGNVSDGLLSTTIVMDAIRPTTPTFVSQTGSPYQNGGTYYYKTGGVTFTATSTDTGGTGVVGYTTDSAGLSPVPAATVTLTASGSIYAVDNVGNVSSSGLGLTVVQDNTPPTISTTNGDNHVDFNLGIYSFTTVFSETGTGVVRILYWNVATRPTGSESSITSFSPNPNTSGSIGPVTVTVNDTAAPFSFVLVDAMDNESAQKDLAWNSGQNSFKGVAQGVFTSAIRVSKSTEAGSSAHHLDPGLDIRFNDGRLPALSEPSPVVMLPSALVLQPINVRYTPNVTERAPPIDTSSLSLLQRPNRTAAKSAPEAAPGTTVRYAQTTASARPSGASGESAVTGVRTAGGTATSASQIPVRSAAPITAASSQTRAAAPTTEPQPLRPASPKPAAPTENSLPRPDLFVGQTREGRDDPSDVLDDGEESDTLNGEESV